MKLAVLVLNFGFVPFSGVKSALEFCTEALFHEDIFALFPSFARQLCAATYFSNLPLSSSFPRYLSRLSRARFFLLKGGDFVNHLGCFVCHLH